MIEDKEGRQTNLLNKEYGVLKYNLVGGGFVTKMKVGLGTVAEEVSMEG